MFSGSSLLFFNDSMCELLTYKILAAEKKPQIYGTQFKAENGKMYLLETIEPEKQNLRGTEMNLPTMKEYLKMLEKLYRLPVVRS